MLHFPACSGRSPLLGVLQYIIFPHLNTIIYSFGVISSLGALVGTHTALESSQIAVLLMGLPSGGMGGLTMSIALFYDIFVILTVHIYVCYAITGAVYAKVLWAMGSLWRLFRGEFSVNVSFPSFVELPHDLTHAAIPGKRFNVLRNRTDSWEYDLDQLLFGTILFTLLAFLFPTVLAYYALFALVSAQLSPTASS